MLFYNYHECPRCEIPTPRFIKFRDEFICQMCYLQIPEELRTKVALEEKMVLK